MDLRGVGPPFPNIDPKDLLKEVAETVNKSGLLPSGAAPSEDTVATLLEALATPEITRLIQSIDQRRAPENSPPIDDLLHAATTAVSEGDAATAIAKLSELIRAAPEQAEVIVNDPALQPIRSETAVLLRNLTSDARGDAEQKLAEAGQLVENEGPVRQQSEGLNLETVLTVANRFFEQAQYSGYVRARDLAQVVIDRYTPVQAASTAGPLRAIPTQDTVATLLQEIVTPEIAGLIRAIEQRRLPENTAPLVDLMRAATEAVSNRDTATAIANLTALVRAAPDKAETIVTEPRFQPIRGEIETLVRRLTSEARSDAELKLSTAARLVETGATSRSDAGGELDLDAVLAVAGRLFQQGRYASYVQAGDLAQVVIDRYGPVTNAVITGVPVSIETRRLERARLGRQPTGLRTAAPATGHQPQQPARRLKTLWRRAPLLILLLGWLGLGLAGAISSIVGRTFWPGAWDASWVTFGFEIWGIGFLALVGFGFYMRIRNVKF
ncbi:MAG TPA: hypothetical protein VJN43_14345 [Bryobacteraceae bacterium]|nr:hypothetical protein [Bryobacteraceae bacterium]